MPVVFEDAHLQVIHAPGETAYAVAAFNTRDTRADGRTFFGRPIHEKYGVEFFGFVSRAANWYPAASVAAAAAAIRPLRRKPLVGYGHSQGGYAVLKHARRLDLAGGVASGPQFSIDPAEGLEDSRFTQHFNPALHQDMRIRAEELQGRLVLAYDPCFRPDVAHVAPILALSPAIEPLCLPYMHHRTVQVLSPRAVLMPLWEAILSGGPVAPAIRAARQARRESRQYTLYLSRALLRRRPALAARLLEGMDLAGLKPDQLRDHGLLLGRARHALGEPAEALAIFRRLQAEWPDSLLFGREASRVEAALQRRAPRAGGAPGAAPAAQNRS
ncbi:tetratricopeptide repeat protein [Pseudoroseomonas cervicalis]|uniref:tetratricopeptide repeat protein n=1 Tax=Teichococcus cervicalis TaxID=204525 RepID=UPI0022F1CA92|nr:tetratricopeptide repeat protein [Pseudoroseomonas cervicalis]WBV43472.1 tetratricopeptide repeat protein [Pseudoroseomonas cervicalis]